MSEAPQGPSLLPSWKPPHPERLQANPAFLQQALTPLLCALLAFLALSTKASAQLSIGTTAEWEAWQRPGNALEMTPNGVTPARVGRFTDAVRKATAFGGGIRVAGSDRAGGRRLIDGNGATAWRPATDDPLADWWIEIDLGRVVSAQRVRLSFDQGGVPLAFFQILTSDGEAFFNNARTIIDGTVVYQEQRRYSFNEAYNVEFELGLRPVRYIRIQVDRLPEGAVGLSELAVDGLGDNLALGIVARGGQIVPNSDEESGLLSRLLTDGNILTFAWNRGGGANSFGRLDIDLGVVYWLEQIRLVGDDSGVWPNWRRGTRHFLWYQLFGAAQRTLDGEANWRLLEEVPANPANQRNVIRFGQPFPRQQARYLQLVFPSSGGFLSELQIFATGYPAEVVMRSPVYDLGGQRNIATIEWLAEQAEGSGVSLRSRTGNLLERQFTHRDRNGEVVTAQRWEKLIPLFRGPIDTLVTAGADWSDWSVPYETPGARFTSPGPRRYTQLEALFWNDDPEAAASLRQIDLTLERPLVGRVQGEIAPHRVVPGQAEDFTYFLRTQFNPGDQGFDRLQVRAETSFEVQEVRVDGAPTEYRLEAGDDGTEVVLAEPVFAATVVEIDWRATLYGQERFDVVLGRERGGLVLRQMVEPGDAGPAATGDDVVVGLSLPDWLLGEVNLSGRLFTPNGDGIADQLLVQFQLLEISAPRPLNAAVYDLSGRLVRSLLKGPATAGHWHLSWDGRGLGGGLVAPGLYVLRLGVEGDARDETVTRLVGVAY
ncbi:MAG: hypothetical protein GKR89_16250 [Candidatus Latescibacteria bacterium]|nr:hypothetical protein [Candidatus Latescibacterota bacterium]